MPFPKQQQGAKAPKGAVPTDARCLFCKQQVDCEDQQGYIQGTCSKCGTRPFCFQCVADHVEKIVRTLNSNSKAMEKGRNIARNRPQDLFAQNRTVQRKPQNCPDPGCSGLMVDAELVKPQKQQQPQGAAEQEEENNVGVPAPPPGRQLPAKAAPAKAPPAKVAAAPVIKRLVSAPPHTRATSASAGGDCGTRAAVEATMAIRTPSSSSSSSLGAALEQQREAAAAIRSDIAASGRRSSAAAPASSGGGRSSTAAGWGKASRRAGARAEGIAAAEEWPSLGPGGNPQAAAQRPAQPPPSDVGAPAGSPGLWPTLEAAAGRPAGPAAPTGAAAESAAGAQRAAPPPATLGAPQPAAGALPPDPSVGSEAGRAAQGALSDSNVEGVDLAGSIAVALRKQQQALLQQLASGQQPWGAAQQAAQQQGSLRPGAETLPPLQQQAPDPEQQLGGDPEQQPAAQALCEPAPQAAQPGLLPLPPHIASQLLPWGQQAAVAQRHAWEQQQRRQQQQQPSLPWQHTGQPGPAGFDEGYAAGSRAAAAAMQQQQGGQPLACEQAAAPALADGPPPQAGPEGDEAEVDALLSLLGIG